MANERARAHGRLVRRHRHVPVEGEGFSAVVLSNALAQSRQASGGGAKMLPGVASPSAAAMAAASPK